MVEAMSIANAILREDDSGETQPLIKSVTSVNSSQVFIDFHFVAELIQTELGQTGDAAPNFEIDRRVEMGQLSALFLGPIGTTLLYTVIIVCLLPSPSTHFELYLYGDLAIYAAAVPNSIQHATGSWSIGVRISQSSRIHHRGLSLFY